MPPGAGRRGGGRRPGPRSSPPKKTTAGIGRASLKSAGSRTSEAEVGGGGFTAGDSPQNRHRHRHRPPPPEPEIKCKMPARSEKRIRERPGGVGGGFLLPSSCRAAAIKGRSSPAGTPRPAFPRYKYTRVAPFSGCTLRLGGGGRKFTPRRGPGIQRGFFPRPPPPRPLSASFPALAGEREIRRGRGDPTAPRAGEKPGGGGAAAAISASRAGAGLKITPWSS